MELQTADLGQDITMDHYRSLARRLLEEGHRENKKVYLEVRYWLHKYADSQNKYCHITVPYWVHKLDAGTLATMLKMWVEMIDENKPRG